MAFAKLRMMRGANGVCEERRPESLSFGTPMPEIVRSRSGMAVP